jgi:biopolymer transport protein ExbD
MKRRLLRRVGRHEPEDINITAFMNLMVILVPFLLMTAVFSRITILELNLPAGTAQEPQAKQRFDLEITVRASGIEVGDRQGGLIRRIPSTTHGQDLAQLSELLQQIKARFPDKLDATLLLEPQIDYDTVVQVMDKVRIARVLQAGTLQSAELFPEIAIGDAPMDSVKVAANSRVKSP